MFHHKYIASRKIGKQSSELRTKKMVLPDITMQYIHEGWRDYLDRIMISYISLHHKKNTFHEGWCCYLGRPVIPYASRLSVSKDMMSARSHSSDEPCDSHSIAICNQRFDKQTELRTHEQPLLAEHKGGTD